MQYYTFPISVKAHTEIEAKAKLELLLTLASFFVDFKIGNLAGAFIKWKLMKYVGKIYEKARQKTKEEIWAQGFKYLSKKSRPAR